MSSSKGNSILRITRSHRNRFLQKYPWTSTINEKADKRRLVFYTENFIRHFWRSALPFLRLFQITRCSSWRFQSGFHPVFLKDKALRTFSCTPECKCPDKICIQRNGKLFKPCLLSDSCHWQYRRKYYLHQQRTYEWWYISLHNPCTRGVSRSSLPDYIFCRSKSGPHPQSPWFRRIYRRMGDL